MTLLPHELVPAINESLEIEIPETGTMEQLRAKLTLHINDLINHHFEKLVFYLYRIDVDEARMRSLLASKDGADAPELIADLIIERQLQKIKYKAEHKHSATRGSEEEKW